jgi:hypothetical protein
VKEKGSVTNGHDMKYPKDAFFLLEEQQVLCKMVALSGGGTYDIEFHTSSARGSSSTAVEKSQQCVVVFQGVVAGGRHAATAVCGDHRVGSDYLDAVRSPQQLPC